MVAAGHSPKVVAKQPSYGNFKGPLGLVMRMLRSGDSAARAALMRAAAEVALAPADWALQRLERQQIAQAQGELLPIFLVVGLPRSGTTLVYQTLAKYLPFSYFDNAGALFPRSLLAVSTLLKDKLRSPRTEFRSFYGNTVGLTGVNDAFHVWNRWMGEDRYTVPQALDENIRDDMRRFFVAWFQAHGRPLLNKNNRNAFGIELLASALESTVFVVVARGPAFVAQSLLKARELIRGNRAVGWGLGSGGEGYIRDPDPLIDVANQVRYCQEIMNRQLARVPRDRVIKITYEDFCTDPAGHVRLVWQRLCEVWPRAAALEPPSTQGLARFGTSERVDLDTVQFQRLRRLLE